ncbi:3-isopropylmalate dehydratase large subunit [Candidatus Kuenenia stuttgartiensis]|jgi:3-isopropylmalate/(R)-2-methylmalate dehydratase large subunit|nr:MULTISPECIES: 3-isopropylmalate dehydratase large subunit [Kuenenia]MBE7547798.1 3-isopropylmalate dehydratase large subunit [Planctomycetia bacterium]MBW7940925.1 3-isopropylmalate dehydratase large subunit [Candidatus Kuenenia stuttgartiensis]MBZ0191285.1 3-isopropylmalate dehydratase large subunit [Candidatus Kuenenia stuttgartiensis]MCF6152508.1 3-isopropylmalate dehydratase large subunit [Candidatus Kuenenia stuttgartiensis]MCL4726163.1 3-isopropylmalate dehydratase large subunit [Cand
MGMTITEKIIAAHCGEREVRPGQFVYANVDVCLGNDITAPIAIEEFEKAGIKKVFDPEKIVLVPDHFTPNKDIQSAQQSKSLRVFAEKHHLKHYFEIGRMGIEHALLPEQGIVAPGELVIGADSHTCTYGALGAFSTGIGSTDLAACFATGKVWLKVPESIKFVFHGKARNWTSGKDFILYTIGKIGVDGALYKAMEFTGTAISDLPMDDRFTICNMAIEAGAKSGIIAPDKITENYVAGRVKREYVAYHSDPDSHYSKVYEFNAEEIVPQVALPSLPENTKSVYDVCGIKIDQVVIGSCTNGRISDLRIAAKILKGKKAHPSLRLIIIPATQEIYKQALKEGLIEIFIDAEAVVSTPTCGPCLGGHMGILAEGERALTTTNRNFVGRMGHPKSEIYLCSPAVAAASAITGKITPPSEMRPESCTKIPSI